MLKELRPIKDKDYYSKSISEYIAKAMFHAMYLPLFRILGKRPEATTLSNALDVSNLKTALLSGRVWFNNDKFYGTFNAAIGRELRAMGARFNSNDKTYFIKQTQIPMDVRAVIGEATSKFKAQQQQILDTLNKMNIPPKVNVEEVKPHLDSMFIDLNKQFTTSVPTDLRVPMYLTSIIQERIATEYTNNMDMYIKDWYEKEIVKLRERVEESVSQGYRADHMRDVLMAEYGVAERKAKFLARQETSLLVSKYRESRYTEAGLRRYRWSTSHDQRVRHDHKELNNKIFQWDNPPITDKHTGARNNPGEDYNCVLADSNINLAYGIRKCFRRWYSGKLTTVITESGKTIRATPNHQVLTHKGWKAIGMLDDTDYIIDLSEQLINFSETNINNGVAFIGNIFESFAKQFGIISCNDSPINFHGDGSNSNIDIICTTGGLMVWFKSFFFKFRYNFLFAFPNKFTFLKSLFFMDILKPFFRSIRIYAFFSFNNFSSFFGNSLSFFKGRILKSQNICFGTSSNFNTISNEPVCDDNSFNTSALRDRQNTFSTKIGFNDWFNINIDKIWWQPSNFSVGFNTHFSKMFRNCICTKADDLADFNKSFSAIQKLDRIVQKTERDFAGHVYNLETINNWFLIDGLVYHNCRCVAIPIVE